ncbi:hypothetical protein Fcan01_19263 [Folsomia candida]|uniref:DUF7779 domain-containing protein n=1 Tax=Folsomia candida TaxID=158441 RepID=A0A226DMN7_FOLCA|nr:hypothetical protein Fcan01_19263 [Folsomia candida]
MENNFPLSDVVEILNRDDYLATQMEKFANLLNIPLSERIHLKDRENYDYITNLLQRWVGRRGKEDANLIKLIEILEKGELKSADTLRIQFGLNDSSNHDDNLPPTRLYVGRSEQEKDILGYRLNSNICIIHGPDGIGKTQFVLKTFKEGINFQFLSGHSITNLRTSLENLAKRLGYNISEQGGIQKSLTDLFKYVSRKGNMAPLVTVIDGLNLFGGETDELKQEIENFIRICSKGRKHFLVITSIRRDIIPLEDFETIVSRFMKLPIFANDEADKYVRSNLEAEDDYNIRELNSELGNYPLAIHQAVETIKFRGITIKTFLADYKSVGLSIDKQPAGSFKASMLSIMRMTMSQIVTEYPSGFLAVQILQLLAFMESDRILLQDLEQISSHWQNVDYTKVGQCTQLLSNFSCIDQDSDKSSVSMHRVVQKVVRLNLRKYQENGQNMEELQLSQFFQKLLNIPFMQESSKSRLTQLARMWTLFSHKYLITYRDLHEIPNQIYSRYVKLGLFSYAKSFIFQQKEIFAKQLGDHDVSTVDIAKSCANPMRNLGDYIKAEKLFRGVLIDEIKLRGVNHKETLDTEHWIVSMLFRQKRYDEAENEAKQLITKCQTANDKMLEMMVTQVLAFIIGRKGQCKYELGEYDDAINIFNNILEDFLEFRTHPDNLRSRYWLIMCKFRKDDSVDRVPILRSCVDELENIIKTQKELGWDDRHPDLEEAVKSKLMIVEEIEAMGPWGGSSVSIEISNVPQEQMVTPVRPNVVINVPVENVGINGDVVQGESTIPDKASEYLDAFEHCTTMIFTRKNLLFVLSPSPRLDQLRRNPVQHCWATFVILPEKSGLFPHNRRFMSQPCFVGQYLPSQYFIWMTTIKHEVQRYLTYWPVLDHLGMREVIIVDVDNLMEGSPLLRLNYHNLYHVTTPHVRIPNSQAWYTIDCVPSNCLFQLGITSKTVFKLNKYFWYSPFKLTHVSDNINLSHHGHHKIASLTTWNDFFEFVILQDVLKHDLRNFTRLHAMSPIGRIDEYDAINELTFLLHGVQSYSFVSCYKTRSNFYMVSALTSPFDKTSWRLLAASFYIVVLILTALHRKAISDWVFIVLGISVESSVLPSPRFYEAALRREERSLIGIYRIVAIWILMVGTILTNWYKTWFTMEMIIPTKYESPWERVMDVEGIQVLMPLRLLEGAHHDTMPRTASQRYRFFYFEILLQCKQIAEQSTTSKGLLAYKNKAKSLLKILLDRFGLDEGLMPINKTTSSDHYNPPLLEKTTLYDLPIQPVEYDEDDSYDILKRLTSCGKVALMEKKENIARITTFLNDNKDGIVFASGDGDSFFTTFIGWMLFPVRGSYPEKRLKVMISSGISAHWEFWYKKWKPDRLLDHFANWTHPRIETVSKLGVSSKITSGFYVCGILLGISTLVLLGEIVRHKLMKLSQATQSGVFMLVIDQ